MKSEDKLYGLMAQAEDIQEHAVKLQKSASEAISALRGATNTVGEEMRYRGLFWAACGTVILLCVGIFVLYGVREVAEWTLTDLRREAEEYRAEVAKLKKIAAKLEDKTWRLELINYDTGQRAILLPKGISVDYTAKEKNRTVIMLKP